MIKSVTSLTAKSDRDVGYLIVDEASCSQMAGEICAVMTDATCEKASLNYELGHCLLFVQVVASYARLDRQLLEARADGGADAAALAAVEASLDKTLSLVVELEGFVKRVLNVA